MHAPATLDDAAALLHEFAAMRRTVGLTGAESAPRSRGSAGRRDRLDARTRPDRGVHAFGSDRDRAGGHDDCAFASCTAQRTASASRSIRLIAEHTTVGGAVASASYGPLRTRYGTTKDTIVGMTIVRADGTHRTRRRKSCEERRGLRHSQADDRNVRDACDDRHGDVSSAPVSASNKRRGLPRLRCRSARELCAAMTQAQLEPSAVYAVYDGRSVRDVACASKAFPTALLRNAMRYLTLQSATADASRSLEAESEAPRTRGGLQVKITAPASLLDELHDHAVAPLYACLGRCARGCVSGRWCGIR